MYKACGYLRLSKDDGDKEISDSIENQKTFIIDYVKKQTDIVLTSFFSDDGYSGLNFERPAFMKMMAEIYKGDINTIITKDMSRLGREHIETSNYIERVFPLHSVRYIAILDNYDSLTGMGVDFAPFKALLNDMYAKDISNKVKSAFYSKMTRGEFIGAFAPYGYKKNPGNNNLLVVDEEPASVVKRIFDLYIKGMSKYSITKVLNNEGILCPSQYKQNTGESYKNSNRLMATAYWTYGTVNRILHNEVYIGHMIQRKSETVSYKVGKKRGSPRERWIIAENTHEPIISPQVFEQASNLLIERKRQVSYSGSVTAYAGILKCGDCGRAMSRSSNGGAEGKKTFYYKCGTYKAYGKHLCTSHAIREDLLTDIVLKAVRDQASRQLTDSGVKELNGFLNKLVQKQKQAYEGNAGLQRLKDIDRYLAKAYEDYADNLFSKEDYINIKERYTAEKKEIESRLSQEKDTNEHQNYEQSWASAFINYLKVDCIKRELVIQLIKEIKVYEDKKIEIALMFKNNEC